MSTTEVEYRYVKGCGWLPRCNGVTGRSAEETKNLTWSELHTGDAVYVFAGGRNKVARVHQKGEPLSLKPDDTGSWLYLRDNERGPYRTSCFGAIKSYGRHDRAWTELIGISFPNGEDYA